MPVTRMRTAILLLPLCLLFSDIQPASAQSARRIASRQPYANSVQRLPNNLVQQSRQYNYLRAGGTTNQSSALYGANAGAVSTRPLSNPISGDYPRDNFRNGLPPTRLDGFVLNAGAHAEHIYGDEGAVGPPPYDHFTEAHRINTGINGDRDLGLTTGHGSYLPDAFGRDEFLGAPEWSQSGTRGYQVNMQAIKNDNAQYNEQQFNNGYQDLDDETYLDEDRVRTPDTTW